LFLIWNSKEKGGQTLRRLPESFPYCFLQGILSKLEARLSGGFRSNFLIVFDKELHGKSRPDAPEASGVISLLF
jgi:hypothetical protein